MEDPFKVELLEALAELLRGFELRSIREMLTVAKLDNSALAQSLITRSVTPYTCMSKGLQQRYRDQTEELIQLLKDLGVQL